MRVKETDLGIRSEKNARATFNDLNNLLIKMHRNALKELQFSMHRAINLYGTTVEFHIGTYVHIGLACSYRPCMFLTC